MYFKLLLQFLLKNLCICLFPPLSLLVSAEADAKPIFIWHSRDRTRPRPLVTGEHGHILLFDCPASHYFFDLDSLFFFLNLLLDLNNPLSVSQVLQLLIYSLIFLLFHMFIQCLSKIGLAVT